MSICLLIQKFAKNSVKVLLYLQDKTRPVIVHVLSETDVRVTKYFSTSNS
jgi:hypothetical protein